MSARRPVLTFVMLLVGHVGTVGPADAGLIQGQGIVTGFAGSAIAFNGTANNDNDTGSGNVPPANSLGILNGVTILTLPIDTEFTVTPTGGVTEYRVQETAVNNTTFAWTSYRLELGFGTGASFVRSTATDALDFDFPNMDPAPFTINGTFATVVHGSDTLDFSGGTIPIDTGTIPPTGQVIFRFALDVPDFGTPSGKFTLRGIPNGVPAAAVPAPATAILLGVGLLAGALTLRRRR